MERTVEDCRESSAWRGCLCGCLWGIKHRRRDLQEDENSTRGRFPILLKGWWESVITPLTGSRLNMKIIGIGGTSSSCYQFCYKVYLDHNNIDFVILDLSVNDAVAIRFKNSGNINESWLLEQFTRQLMNEPNHRAIMFINFLNTKNRSRGCFNLMDLGQSPLTNHYNITTVNLRNLACHAIRKPLNHISTLTHETINDCGQTTSNISQHEPLPPPLYIKPTSRIIKNA